MWNAYTNRSATIIYNNSKKPPKALKSQKEDGEGYNYENKHSESFFSVPFDQVYLAICDFNKCLTEKRKK